MTEQQIKDGFDRLAGALAPPPDALDRVDGRVRVRRRRRRTGLVAGVALAVVATAGTAVALSGGDEGDLVAVDPPAGPTSTLVMTRPDGSTVAFEDVTVSCDPPVTSGGEPVDKPTADRIWAYSPIELSGSLEDDDVTVQQPFMLIQAIPSQLRPGLVLDYPIAGRGGASPEPVNVFIADTEGAVDGNEVSSSVGDAGQVRVVEASCDPIPVLRLEVRGALGSEEGKQSLELVGELR